MNCKKLNIAILILTLVFIGCAAKKVKNIEKSDCSFKIELDSLEKTNNEDYFSYQELDPFVYYGNPLRYEWKCSPQDLSIK